MIQYDKWIAFLESPIIINLKGDDMVEDLYPSDEGEEREIGIDAPNIINCTIPKIPPDDSS